VYEIKEGKLDCDLTLIEHEVKEKEFSHVCLTYDGQYAIWVDDLYVKAARIRTKTMIACICTHEVPISLATMDFGYVVVIGREDGHIITAKLIDGENMDKSIVEWLDHKERTKWLMEKMLYPDGSVACFDKYYQNRPKKVAESHIPQFTKDMQKVLSDRTNKPLSFIKKGNSCDNLNNVDVNTKRRGSSPFFFEGRKSKDSSPAGSPATLPRGLNPYKRNQSAAEILHNGAATVSCRSRLFHKSPSLHNLNATQKALESSAHIIQALFTKNKRKSSESEYDGLTPPNGSPFMGRRTSKHSPTPPRNRHSPTPPRGQSPQLNNQDYDNKEASLLLRARQQQQPKHSASEDYTQSTSSNYRKLRAQCRFYSTTEGEK
jgi:hypothetical protein